MQPPAPRQPSYSSYQANYIPALVKGLAPNAPEKNRKMITVHMFCDPMRPALKAVKAA
jgi:hypothetical protein